MRSQLMRLLKDNAKSAVRRPVVPAAENANGQEATIYLYDVICSSTEEAEWFGGIAPEAFVKELNAITAQTIHLRINCPGGAVFGGRAIEAAIREHKAKIIAHVDGYAASAASFVAIACDEVEIAKGAFFMIHKAWCGVWGNCDDMLAMAGMLEKIDGTIAESYADKTGKEKDELLAMMQAETWLTGQESVDIGLADRLADASDASAASGWNLSAYANAPASEDGVAAFASDGDKTPQESKQDTEDNREWYERRALVHGNMRPADSRTA